MCLPDSFADLSALTILDVSENALTTLPPQLFALPNLATLNIAHNAITTLPFGAPFSSSSGHSRPRSSGAGSFFTLVATYAETPLPKLVILDASNNKLTAESIDYTEANFPKILSKLDLSGNPLGNSQTLIRSMAKMKTLKELRMKAANISDMSFPLDLFSPSAAAPFPSLSLLDLGDTKVTIAGVEASLSGKVKQELNFDWATEDPPAGVLRVLVGKKVVKEAWELEAERRARLRAAKPVPQEDDAVMAGMGKGSGSGSRVSQPATKEPWEIEAEQGLLTEGGRRRARAAAAAAATAATSESSNTKVSAPKEVKKEAWEIEAEQGLLTEGGRRRARAMAAAAAQATRTTIATDGDAVPSLSRKPSSIGASLTSSQYYVEKASTLTLPPSAPAPKGHARAFSHASAWAASGDSGKIDITLPTPTLPLAIITSQPYADTLRVLILKGRRLDVSFSVPAETDLENKACLNLLPALEELSLEGCGVKDFIPVSKPNVSAPADIHQPPLHISLLPLLVKLFPRLRTLDLSDNALTDASLSTDALSSLILAAPPSLHEPSLDQAPPRPGLKHLRLRGNRIMELNGLQGLAEMFKGNRVVNPDWALEELDLRDNEIGKLPPELGLLPLDVFLVDGNM